MIFIIIIVVIIFRFKCNTININNKKKTVMYYYALRAKEEYKRKNLNTLCYFCEVETENEIQKLTCGFGAWQYQNPDSELQLDFTSWPHYQHQLPPDFVNYYIQHMIIGHAYKMDEEDVKKTFFNSKKDEESTLKEIDISHFLHDCLDWEIINNLLNCLIDVHDLKNSTKITLCKLKYPIYDSCKDVMDIINEKRKEINENSGFKKTTFVQRDGL